VGYSKNKLILNAAMWIDNFSCKSADKIILVERDMQETLRNRLKNKNVPNNIFINNWINEKEIYPLASTNEKVAAFKQKYRLNDKFVIMYSGNIGLYYDLENLMTVIEKFKKNKDIVFAFVGAGTVKDKLVNYVNKHKIDNVAFIPYQSKEDLIYSLNACDVQWCISAKGIKGVSVPSKLYGIMAVGKPVIGVMEEGAEARLIMEETQCGLVCEPGDYEAVERNIQWFIDHAGDLELKAMGIRGRDNLVKNLTKDISVKKYIGEILSC
jgi:glycosyltransferase involved in cell wall biosynthesis